MLRIMITLPKNLKIEKKKKIFCNIFSDIKLILDIQFLEQAFNFDLILIILFENIIILRHVVLYSARWLHYLKYILLLSIVEWLSRP